VAFFVARWERSVDRVPFTITQDETLGLAGESGCGTISIAIVNIHRAMTSRVRRVGEIIFHGT